MYYFFRFFKIFFSLTVSITLHLILVIDSVDNIIVSVVKLICAYDETFFNCTSFTHRNKSFLNIFLMEMCYPNRRIYFKRFNYLRTVLIVVVVYIRSVIYLINNYLKNSFLSSSYYYFFSFFYYRKTV